MATNNTRQISKLQAEKARLLARIEQIDAQIEELSQVDELADAVQEVLDSTPRTPGQRSGKAKGRRGDGGEWIDERMINGCGPYYYRRWIENGKKRSEYLGKTKPA
jgi:hypothetical protein